LCKVVQKAPRVEKKEPEVVVVKPKKTEKEEDGEDGEEPVEKKVKEEDSFPVSTMDFDGFKKDFMNSTIERPYLMNSLKRNMMQMLFLSIIPDIIKEALNAKNFGKLKTDMIFHSEMTLIEKFAFAAFGIYGVEGDYEIRGVWLWRGRGIPSLWINMNLLNITIEENLAHLTQLTESN